MDRPLRLGVQLAPLDCHLIRRRASMPDVARVVLARAAMSGY